MADSDHTLESSSAQENSPLVINLIVDEIFVAAPKGIGCIALSVLSREYEPSILLQGEWVREMGFEKGQHVQVVAKTNLLKVERVNVTANASGKLSFDKDRFSLFKDFTDELDAIKACCDDRKQGERGDWSGGAQGSETGSEKGNENRCAQGSKNGGENGDRNGSKSDDKSEVLAEVNCGDARD